jgi:hypothetical protein
MYILIECTNALITYLVGYKTTGKIKMYILMQYCIN